MTACDFEVSIEIHDGVTETILGDLNDRPSGLTAGVPLATDDDQLRRIVTDSPFVWGDFEVLATPAAGRVDVVLIVTGADWLTLNTTYRTAREWWRQSGSFHLDVTLEGDTLRYLARRPDVSGGQVTTTTLLTLERTFLLSFPVQPNPATLMEGES